MSRKIKVFLGAYINQTNAQNLNCRTLAEHLDKSRFEIYTLTIGHGNLGMTSISDVRIFNCKYPVKLTQIFGFFWGIMNSEVAYLPRGNNYKLQRFLVRIFNRKSFKTMENIIDEESLKSALSALGNIERAKENYSFVSRVYSITGFMKAYNNEHHGIDTEGLILPPVIDTMLFESIAADKKALKRIVFLGNDMKRKRVEDFVSIAEKNPDLDFVIVGNGGSYLSEILENKEFKNISYLGILAHEELLKKLASCDLHILTSRSEGFPKGIIECAAAGIPSIVYNDYGAAEWIENWENGVVCKTQNDIQQAIERIKSTPDLLSTLSKGAIELSNRYDVEKVVKLYETVIEDLYAS